MAIRTLALLLLTVIASAQHKRTIDSINNIAVESIVASGDRYEKVYLRNASDAKSAQYPLGLAQSYARLALIYYYRGRYELNVKYRLAAIELYKKLGLTGPLADQYGELGYSMKRRNMKKAQQYMQTGIKLAESESLLREKLKLYDNYGVLKEMQGQLDSALLYYRRGLDIKEQVRDSIGIPYSLSNIAGIHVMRGEFDKAKPIYERALAIRRAKNEQLGIAESLTFFGNMYMEQKDYATAIRYFTESLEVAQRHGYVYAVQTCYAKLAECHERLGDFAQALMHYKRHVKYKDSITNRETNIKVAEMEVKFETHEKERRLLEKQAELDQRNLLLLILALATLFIAVTGYLIYRQQKLRNRQMAQQHELKSAIAQIETQNKLQEQRLAISRDLHDNIGAQLTFIISSVDNTRYAFDTDNTKLGSKLESIGQFARETIIELRDTIWAMNHAEITMEELGGRISNFIEKASESGSTASFDFSLDDALREVTLTSSEGMHLYRTMQEAVNNAVKYASAQHIDIRIMQKEGNIAIDIRDDGRGFDIATARMGNGLANMSRRMEAIGAKITTESNAGEGTRITIEWPIPKNPNHDQTSHS